MQKEWYCLLGLYLLAANLAAFLLMGLDKHRAQRSRRRVSEKTLFLPAALGGALGGTLGMHLFHHKTRHWYFRWGYPLLLILQLAALGWLALEISPISDTRFSAAAQTPAPEQTPEPTKPIEEQECNMMTITINGRTFSATLCDNETTAALKTKLPLTLSMSELNGNEKYNYLPFSLPTNAGNPGQIHAGDLMLYGPDCLVLFYESFSTSYRYTPIGRISDPSGLADAVGGGGVQVTFALS